MPDSLTALSWVQTAAAAAEEEEEEEEELAVQIPVAAVLEELAAQIPVVAVLEELAAQIPVVAALEELAAQIPVVVAQRPRAQIPAVVGQPPQARIPAEAAQRPLQQQLLIPLLTLTPKVALNSNHPMIELQRLLITLSRCSQKKIGLVLMPSHK